MGTPHGQTAPQDHRHLPPLPRGHPRGPPQRTHPELTTGEPCVRETDQHGSGRGRRKRTRTTGTSPAAHFTRRGVAGKGPETWVPRRRPTLPRKLTAVSRRRERRVGGP